MTRTHQTILFLLVLGALLFGIGRLYQERFGLGDVYPAYSSFRADPLGTRALYEALTSLPGLDVERSLKTLDELPSHPSHTLILAGTGSNYWEKLEPKTRRALDNYVRAGNRVAVIFASETQRRHASGPIKKQLEDEKKQKEEKAKKANPASPKDAPDEKPADEASDINEAILALTTDWKTLWGVELASRWMVDGNHGASRHVGAPENLPTTLPWHSDLYFELPKDTPWRTLYTHGARPAMIERELGQGSIVLAADAYFISNEALQRDRASNLLVWLIGDKTQVVFSENQLDLGEEGGIAVLARRYGLAGAFFMLLLLALLYVWRESAQFVPPIVEPEEVTLHYHPTAGLTALLRRALRKPSLFGQCRAEWKTTARPSDVARIDRIDDTQPPVDAYNAAINALRRR